MNKNWETVSSFIKNDGFKHYSFDFWNTLAFSNSKFKEERSRYILSLLPNVAGVSEINKLFEQIGAEYNVYQESGNPTLAPVELLKKVINSLDSLSAHYDISKIKDELDILFLKYPPTIDSMFYEIADEILAHNKTCSVTSNTAFVSGEIIRALLSNVGLLDKFSFCVFSDEVGCAKPDAVIYQHLYRQAKTIYADLHISEIVHFGDNLKSDYYGALDFGFKAFHFNSEEKLKYSRFAVHDIADSGSIPFVPAEYSNFKFGDSDIAKKYGNELFKYFEKNHISELIYKNTNFLIYSSPYSHIPTSSYYLTEAFYSAFKAYLHENGIENVNLRFCKIRRCQTYTEDYGAMSAEERFNLIKNDTYEFEDVPSDKDVCIFIDDISITGTHQRVVEKLLNESACMPKSIFLYYAKLSNKSICPSFENYLNYYSITDFKKILEIILTDSYKITTRTAKYILSLQKKDLECIIGQIRLHDKYSILSELVNMSYANKYNDIERYKQNLADLEMFLQVLNTEPINS